MNYILFASYSTNKNPGITKKIGSISALLDRLGYDLTLVSGDTTFSLIIYFYVSLLLAPSGVCLYIRFSCFTYPLIVPALIIARFIKKASVVTEIPSPLYYSFYEASSPGRLLLISVFILVSFPLLVFSNRILQRGHEYFPLYNIFFKRRTFVCGNSVVPIGQSTLLQYPPANQYRDGVINLVSVSNLCAWHGVDRLIKAIHLVSQLPKYSCPFTFNLTVVSTSTPELQNCRSIVTALRLSSYVSFVISPSFDSLTKIYSKSHVGIGSMALDRARRRTSSELKLREYISYGLFVLCTDHDIDLSSMASDSVSVMPKQVTPELIAAYLYLLPSLLKKHSDRSVAYTLDCLSNIREEQIFDFWRNET